MVGAWARDTGKDPTQWRQGGKDAEEEARRGRRVVAVEGARRGRRVRPSERRDCRPLVADGPLVLSMLIVCQRGVLVPTFLSESNAALMAL